MAMAGAGGLAPHEKRRVHREGKAKAALTTRTAFLGSRGAEILEGAGPARERSGRRATAVAGLPLEAERSAATSPSTRRPAPARLPLPAQLSEPSLSLPVSSLPAFRPPACFYLHQTHFFPSPPTPGPPPRLPEPIGRPPASPRLPFPSVGKPLVLFCPCWAWDSDKPYLALFHVFWIPFPSPGSTGIVWPTR